MSTDHVTSPWPRRFALATLGFTIPLILFGGTVTTLREGMAEDGWLRPDGYLLWLYPIELRLRNVGTFVEHHHREFGSLVGLMAIGLVISTLRCDRRRSARWLAVATLTAICIQGAIGGFRVLENNPDLAFLHGAVAHGVFALIGANVFVSSAAWRERRGADRASASAHAAHEAPAGTVRLHRVTLLASLAVYAQIVAGAWVRHTGAALALGLHFFLAALVVVELLRAGRALDGTGLERLAGFARRTRRLVVLQIALGFGAAIGVYGFSGGYEGQVSAFELVFATSHVLIGALLLWQTVGAAMWSRHLLPARATAVLGGPSATPALQAVHSGEGA